MFTGIVIERGRILNDPAPSGQGGVALRVGHSGELAARLEIGASLAVSGVCLTVTRQGEVDAAGTGEASPGENVPDAFSDVELSPETLERTHLDDLAAGSEVNLEPALRAGDALGGHLVQGHVDGTLALADREDLDDHSVFTFELSPEAAPYVVEKGSICLDGVSLTVARLLEDRFTVALIPHTLEWTTLGAMAPGQRVNYEVDVMAKYVERLLATRFGGGAGGKGAAEDGSAPWEGLG